MSNTGFLGLRKLDPGQCAGQGRERTMEGGPTLVHRFDPRVKFSRRYRTGISLHSHTMHSREYLDRLPTYIAKFPIGAYILEREIGRLHLYEGRIFNFKKYYWTPPLSPREAHELESRQIEERLALRAEISLSDHNNIEAGMHLRMLERTARAPISLEWSVPYGETVFHLGVHNLPGSRAKAWMEEFAAYTASPDPNRLRELLESLNAERCVLIVLNHPFWDAESLGPEQHRAALGSFLRVFLPMVHAIELNGLRSRKENRMVVKLGDELQVPVISGGDRHGCEANAVLNVTNAGSFEEFVQEVREDRRSEVLQMPQFFEPLALRLVENAWHALSDAPGEFGRRHWMTRVFIEENGKTLPLSQFTGTKFHRFIDKFRWVIGLVANPMLRPALRLPFLGNEDGGL